MTSRERLIAAARGGEVDQKPTLCWHVKEDSIADAVVLGKLSAFPSDTLVLVEVEGIYGAANRTSPKLLDLLANDPAEGEALLNAAVTRVREQIYSALSEGADGVFYVLRGATPEECSPMEYGGHFLEKDREVLAEVADATLNAIFVEGGEGVYLDFVSDLPAHLFGWDVARSGIPVHEVRAMRAGALLADSPEADVLLTCHSLENNTEMEALAAV